MESVSQIYVTIHCSDKAVKYPLSYLIKYDYFKKMLGNCNTKMFWEEYETVENDISFTNYRLKIPHLNFDNSSEIFYILLNDSYRTLYFMKEPEKILTLMLYIDMMQLPFILYIEKIYNSHDDNYAFFKYIKTQYPHLNVYEMLKRGKIHDNEYIIRYAFKLLANDQLDAEFVDDLFYYLDEYLAKKYKIGTAYHVNTYYNMIDVNVIKSIKNFAKMFPLEIMNKVNSEIIKKFLMSYETEIELALSGDNYSYHYSVRKMCYRKLKKMFEEFAILEKMGLISLADLGKTIDNYKKYIVY